jgi:PTH1 family peptidyl-tRNA hydrolase
MSDKFLIVGLGNPGSEYEKTRHNIGFMVVDQIAKEASSSFKKGRNAAVETGVNIAGHSVILAKPLTFMNNSGSAVAGLMNYYDVDIDRLFVIMDEVELPFGRLRVRKQGSSAGHNGMKSIIQHINSQEFARLRIGIGTEYAKKDMSKFVLSNFSRNEQQELDLIVGRSVDVVHSFIRDGIDRTMNTFNTSPAE